MKKEFTNEFGNPIRVEAEKKDVDGVSGVLLTIAGPSSTNENHVTRAEAEAMRDALISVLQ